MTLNPIPYTGDFKHVCDVISDIRWRSEESCNLTNRNKFSGDTGALRCLASGVADVAFISTYNLPKTLRKHQNIKY